MRFVRHHYAVIGYVVLLAVVGLVLIRQQGQIAENGRSRIALCAFRAQLEDRIASTDEFLRANPNGIPGIPAALIRQGQAKDVKTARTLRVLKCSDLADR